MNHDPSGFERAWWAIQHEDAELFVGPEREPLFWDVEDELAYEAWEAEHREDIAA